MAAIPIIQMQDFITLDNSLGLTLGFKRGLYIFQLAIEEADNIDESAEDITAAATAPNPIVATQGGVIACITVGKISKLLAGAPPKLDQSATCPITPIIIGGIDAIKHTKPARMDRFLAVFSSLADNTR